MEFGNIINLEGINSEGYPSSRNGCLERGNTYLTEEECISDNFELINYPIEPIEGEYLWYLDQLFKGNIEFKADIQSYIYDKGYTVKLGDISHKEELDKLIERKGE